jgi:thiamine pyrophosphate-dependent acetolactate synthase large subunit-like protein
MSGKINKFPITRVVVVVTDRDHLTSAAATGLADLAAGGTRLTIHGDTGRLTRPSLPVGYDQVIQRSRRFLDQVIPDEHYVLIAVKSLNEVATSCSTLAPTEQAVITLLVVDHPAYRCPLPLTTNIEEQLAKVAVLLPANVEFVPSPATVQVYSDDDDTSLCVERFTPRWAPAEPWVMAADIVCAFTDSIQLHQTRRLRPALVAGSLGSALADFLDAQAGVNWGLHFYTGSMVSTTIQYLEERSRTNGNPIVRGPSEHSLACSALARWILDRAPFLIVVTSGMVDEFRGTLANLLNARARGFLVCADSRTDQWQPFQGTIHSTEDSRAVIRARGGPTVHLDRVDKIADGLREAFDLYLQDRGPVLIFATRDVLQATGAVPMPDPIPPDRVESVKSDQVDELVHLLESSPRRLLCQVGQIDNEARELVHRLARGAGVALVDSLSFPGSVSRYCGRDVVPEFIGTLSLYGYSARVHQFLHENGRLRPAAEQALIFLNNRIAEIDTPFSERALRRIMPIQITEHPTDLAPFVSMGIAGPLSQLLREVLERLDVDPAVLASRRAAIESTAESFSDVVGQLPIRPMSPNYFFRELNTLLHRLILDEEYSYAGVYDVGRAGLSAVSDLPRTGPGHSGWFGRALMGDALQSLPGVIACRDENILAFIGDGAAALVPDIVPSLVQQSVIDRQSPRRNLTVFRFVNGGHSMIRSYREGRQAITTGSQTEVLTFIPPDWEQKFGALTVSHSKLTDFPSEFLAERLQSPARIDTYTVLMGHNNESNGLSPYSADGWQRDELSARATFLSGAPAAELITP